MARYIFSVAKLSESIFISHFVVGAVCCLLLPLMRPPRHFVCKLEITFYRRNTLFLCTSSSSRNLWVTHGPIGLDRGRGWGKIINFTDKHLVDVEEREVEDLLSIIHKMVCELWRWMHPRDLLQNLCTDTELWIFPFFSRATDHQEAHQPHEHITNCTAGRKI